MSSLAKRVIMPRDEPHSAEEVRPEELRLLEAMLFASAEPLDETTLAARLPAEVDLPAALTRLQEDYAIRGVNLVGLERKSFPAERVKWIKEAFRLIYRSKYNTGQALEAVRKELPQNEEVREIVEFIEKTERGIIR